MTITTKNGSSMKNVREDSISMKTCAKCKTEKPIDDFYIFNQKRNGKLYVSRASYCKKCNSSIQRDPKYRKALKCDCGGGLGGDGMATERWRGAWVCKECKRRDQNIVRWSNGHVDWDCNKYYERETV